MAPNGSGTERLIREYKSIARDPLPLIAVKPEMDNLLVWHFAFYDLPLDSPYAYGLYHGRLDFPKEYPFSPPKIRMMTPNGRFKCNYPLCFSMSNYHTESWNPSWRVETILTDAANPDTHGSTVTSDDVKKDLAIKSFASNKANSVFRRLFPEFCDDSKFIDNVGFRYTPPPTTQTTTDQRPIRLAKKTLQPFQKYFYINLNSSWTYYFWHAIVAIASIGLTYVLFNGILFKTYLYD